MKHLITLTTNDPREGWKYATSTECASIEEAYARVKVKRSEHKRFQFAIRIESDDRSQCKTFVLRRGKFIGLADNVPLDWFLSSRAS